MNAEAIKSRAKALLGIVKDWATREKKYSIPIGFAIIMGLLTLVLYLFRTPEEHDNSNLETTTKISAPHIEIPGFEQLPPIMTVSLYFLHPEGDRLAAEERDVAIHPTGENSNRFCSILIHELIKGSVEGNVSILPSNARLRHCFWSNDGILYLDFDHTFLLNIEKGSSAQWLAIQSILRTVQENISSARQVQFIFDGKPIDDLIIESEAAPEVVGHLDFSHPFVLSEL